MFSASVIKVIRGGGGKKEDFIEKNNIADFKIKT